MPGPAWLVEILIKGIFCLFCLTFLSNYIYIITEKKTVKSQNLQMNTEIQENCKSYPSTVTGLNQDNIF